VNRAENHEREGGGEKRTHTAGNVQEKVDRPEKQDNTQVICTGGERRNIRDDFGGRIGCRKKVPPNNAATRRVRVILEGKKRLKAHVIQKKARCLGELSKKKAVPVGPP